MAKTWTAQEITELLWQAATEVNSENPHDGRSAPGKAWSNAAWEVVRRARHRVESSGDAPTTEAIPDMADISSDDYQGVRVPPIDQLLADTTSARSRLVDLIEDEIDECEDPVRTDTCRKLTHRVVDVAQLMDELGAKRKPQRPRTFTEDSGSWRLRDALVTAHSDRWGGLRVKVQHLPVGMPSPLEWTARVEVGTPVRVLRGLVLDAAGEVAQ